VRAVVLSVLAVLAVACNTTPVPSSSAVPIPEKRIYAPEFTRAETGFALAVVTRDKGLKAKDCIARLYVDGTHVADMRPSEQIRLFVAEGQTIFGVNAYKCFGGGSDQISVDVTRAKPVLLRISVGNGKGMTILPSAF
jgi:hypothetical protein